VTGNRRTFARLPGGGYVYTLLDEGVRVEVRHLRRAWGAMHAEVDVQCEWAGALRHGLSLSCADLNLSLQDARVKLANYCARRSRSEEHVPRDEQPQFDWVGVIDAACIQTLQAERTGDESLALDDAPDMVEATVNVWGLQIPLDGPSLLISPGGGLKSLVLLLVAGTLALEGRTVLYIDYEWTASRHKARKLRLFGAEPMPGLRYIRCKGPLTHELPRLRKEVETHGVTFCVLDSVGMACEGPLKDDDTARGFYGALALLPPTMSAGHITKAQVAAPDAERMAFGSAFFTNLARMNWDVRKVEDPVRQQATISIKGGKQNDGNRDPPVGLRFVFSPDMIAVSRVAVADEPELAAALTIPQRLPGALARGPKTIAELAYELEAQVRSVEKALKRGEERGLYLVVPNGPDGVTRWGRAERHHA
jgi:hypothetical protein